MTTEIVLAVDRVSKSFGALAALDGVSFDVRAGEVFSVIGPNGAGKTTLGHILCTILRPDSGSARINGIDVVRNPLAARRSLGVVFQEPSLDDRLTLYGTSISTGSSMASRRRSAEAGSRRCSSSSNSRNGAGTWCGRSPRA